MKRLSKKLHSESGASILMALLLLLVCMMVAASILGAAASNAGKYRSNRVEQQKYLTLSSAIQLIADEVAKAEYTGKYTVYEWTVETKDADNNVISSEDFFRIEQTPGDYSCGVRRSGDTNPGELTNQLPLGKELDEIFSKQFTGTGYIPLSSDLESSTERNLTITLPDGLTGYPEGSALSAYNVSKVVTVQVKLDHATKHITLTAWEGDGDLADAGDETMIAELTLKEGTTPVIDYSPGGRTATNDSMPADANNPTTILKKTSTMEWELHWIKKGAA